VIDRDQNPNSQTHEAPGVIAVGRKPSKPSPRKASRQANFAVLDLAIEEDILKPEVVRGLIDDWLASAIAESLLRELTARPTAEDQ
jgi:hypothetical protein